MIKLQRHQKTLANDDSGFTIIESLIGIVIVAILLAAISPVLVMSTSIRVQSKRIEKAAQVTNSFIDGVRTKSIPVPGKVIALTAASSTNARTLSDNLITLTKMPVPTSTSASSNTDQDLYLAKKDGTFCLAAATGCTRDTGNPFDEFYVQAAQIKVTGSTSNDGYRLAIRVYRGDVDFSKTLLASSSSIKTVDSPITAGMGDKQVPLIERTVDIANSSTTFQALCSRLGIAQKKDASNVLQNQNCPQ